MNRWGQDPWTGRDGWRSTTDLTYAWGFVICSQFRSFFPLLPQGALLPSTQFRRGFNCTGKTGKELSGLSPVTSSCSSFTKAVGLTGTIKLPWLKIRPTKANSPVNHWCLSTRVRGDTPLLPAVALGRQTKHVSWQCHQQYVQAREMHNMELASVLLMLLWLALSFAGMAFWFD